MVYILTIATSVASAMLVFILQSLIRENAKLKKEKEEHLTMRGNALENGVLCLLRAKMIEYHTKYMDRGAITAHGIQSWLQMYKAYKGLGGNGMIDHMKDEIESLHIENH
jgi:hypothetical protein